MILRIVIFLIIFLLIIAFGVFYYFYYYSTKIKKELILIWPQGGEELRAGKTYQIQWKARKVSKIDIILINGEGKKEILAENFPAKEGKFEWKILAWKEPREDYKILIEEKEGEKISDISQNFSVLGPKFFSCEQLSIENQWPFIPSDYPQIKRVFITQDRYPGDLGGLEGADRICQQEAEKMGLRGNWKAFLGDENVAAEERLNLEGIFVESEGFVLPQGDVIPNYFWESFKKFIERAPGIREQKNSYLSAHKYLEKPFFDFIKQWNQVQEMKYCYRLLGKNYKEFLMNLTFSPSIKEKVGDAFFSKLSYDGAWIGRIEAKESKECLEISNEGFSFTVTCQNWRKKGGIVEDGKICYDEKGNKVNSILIGGKAILFDERLSQFKIKGKNCGEISKLICIEQ